MHWHESDMFKFIKVQILLSHGEKMAGRQIRIPRIRTKFGIVILDKLGEHETKYFPDRLLM